MKTLLPQAQFFVCFLLFAILCCQLPVQAQQVKTSLYLQKYRSITLGFGPRFLDTNPGTITTTFVDDSPSMDSFVSDFDVQDGYTQFGINFGYKFGRYRGLSHDLLFDVTTSKSYTIKVAYSIGWNFLFDLGNKNLVIRPGLQGFFSNTSFQLGQIENNAAYIQIGERQYFEDELNVELRAESGSVAPRLDITYVFAERFDAYIKAAYDISSNNTNPRIAFEVPDGDRTADSPPDSSLMIDGDNPLVTYNGEKLEVLPYNPGGLRLTVGVSFLWNR